MRRIFAILSILCMILASCMSLSACRRYKYPEGEREAKNLQAFLEEKDCLGEFSLWRTIANEDKIELSFRGEGTLQEVFAVTEIANEYLDMHPESIIYENNLDLCISFYPQDSNKNDYEHYRYFACVEKGNQDARLNLLQLHTEKLIHLSDFRDCKVVFKNINATYNVVFDDPEVLLDLDGLEAFSFDDLFVSANNESVLSILQAVCYYEDNNILPPFRFEFYFSGNAELKSTFDDFVRFHPDYIVFSSLNVDTL